MAYVLMVLCSNGLYGHGPDRQIGFHRHKWPMTYTVMAFVLTAYTFVAYLGMEYIHMGFWYSSAQVSCIDG